MADIGKSQNFGEDSGSSPSEFWRGPILLERTHILMLIAGSRGSVCMRGGGCVVMGGKRGMLK